MENNTTKIVVELTGSAVAIGFLGIGSLYYMVRKQVMKEMELRLKQQEVIDGLKAKENVKEKIKRKFNKS